MRRSVRVGVLAGGAAALLGLAALGLLRPHAMSGGAAWGVVVLAVLFGFGGLVRRLARVEIGLGEQLAAGTVAWIGLSGVLVALGVASTIPLAVLAALGFAAALAELVQRGLRAERVWPAWSRGAYVLLGLLGVWFAVNLIGWVSSRGNPYDDHAAYTALVARVLDVGDLVEPFSFRRLSAYGGQTMLLALVALRGDVESIDLLDRGIYPIVAILVLLDLMHQRKLHVAARTVIVLFVLAMWEVSINSASIWSGFVVFLAAYQFATKPGASPRVQLALAFAACGAACTLRQNFLAPAGLFAILLAIGHVRTRARETSWRAAVREERVAVALAIGLAAAIVLPYMVAAWRSNHTFLYPILLGTGNPVAPLQPTGNTLVGELAFFFGVVLTPEPIKIWWVLLPAMLVAVDPRPRKPFACFGISATFGFVFLVHSFTLSDSSQLWRYAFAYMTPLVAIFLVETAGRLPFFDGEEAPLRLPAVAALVVWLAVIVQFVETRNIVPKKLAMASENIAAGFELGSSKEGARQREAYAQLQAAVPRGAPLAVLVDRPYLFDFARNPIANLDMPGYASPAPGLPSFEGPEAIRAYFVQLGYRYVAFIDYDAADYLYRRAGWFTRMFRDGEIWQFIAAHMVDLEDSFAALARTRPVLFHGENLYLIDLGDRPPAVAADPTGEIERMDRFVRERSELELHNPAWELAPRRDLVFVSDSSGPSDVDLAVPTRMPRADGGLLARVFGTFEATPPPPRRWLSDRTHIRVRGDGRGHLHVAIDLDLDRLFTRPTITFTLAGQELGSVFSPLDGHTTFDADAACTGWCDLYISVSTVSEWWLDAGALRAVALRSIRWTRVP